ncbi:hypothetical protein GCM10029978_019210 [Actinoallomurus acanthiterrae]
MTTSPVRHRRRRHAQFAFRGSLGLRRVNLALFVAGLTTFMSLYSTQALLPELSRVSPTTSSVSDQPKDPQSY